jgi:chemotaxis response regulator CheB
MPAAEAIDGEPLVYGRIYIAPADKHLMLARGHVRVVRGPKENRHRPSIDVLFRSAALAYGARVTAVILSGSDDDGAAGAKAVRDRGGAVMVQDPEEAMFATMPESVSRVLADVPRLKINDPAAAIPRHSRNGNLTGDVPRARSALCRGSYGGSNRTRPGNGTVELTFRLRLSGMRGRPVGSEG